MKLKTLQLRKQLCIYYILIILGAGSSTDLLAGVAKGGIQQQASGSITGRITDTNGHPLSGASVKIVELSRTVASDDQGNYTIPVAPGTYTVEVSYISYALQQQPGVVVRAGVATAVNFQLVDQSGLLTEVVVVGYGVQKKENLTGAVGQITSKEIENRPAPNLTRLLQGTIPNLNLRITDGSPIRGANYNVRGMTSIGAGGSALILIDGVEGDPNLINPNDVESVSVLKDASSAAVYGSRAAFGVVLITTKSAEKGRTRIDFNSNYSINRRTVAPDLVTNGYQWAKNFDEAFSAWYDYNSRAISVNSIFPFSLEYLEELGRRDADPSLPKVEYNEALSRYEYFGNEDWFGLLYADQIPSTEQSLSISGGTDIVNYYLSGRYYYQDGIFNYNPDQFNRYNLRAKGDVRVAPWLTVENNFEYSNHTYSIPMLADRDNNTIWRMFDVLAFPMATLYNPDGTFSQTGVNAGLGAFIDGNNRSVQGTSYVRNTVGAIVRPWDDRLTLKADFTYSKDNGHERRVNNFVNYSNAPGHSARLGRSLLQQFTNERDYIASNVTIDYSQLFNDKHDVKGLLGYNVESSSYTMFNASRDGILIESKPDFNLMDGLNYTISGGGNEWAYMGLFYRVNYAYDDRYLLEFNGRYDGSSKFPPSQRFGFFPSVSAGWRLGAESFMDWSKGWLGELKIRGSYGSLGNGNVAPYRYLEQMSVQRGGVILNGIHPNYTQMPGVIPDGLTWEKSTTLNFGLDFSAFRNRLGLTFDWYDRQTQDMFTVGQPLPNVFGATVPFGNYADLTTKGWEATLSWRESKTLFGKPFEYGFNGSLWDSKSEITKFNNPNGNLSATYYVGHQVGEIWGYETMGLFQSFEEIEAHADQNFLQNSNNRQWFPGDIKFADLNGDGVINAGDNTIYNPGDRRVIGNNSPRYQFGFTLNGRWNGIGVSAFFQGIGKRDWYFAGDAGMFWGLYNRPYGFQPKMMMEDIWTEVNVDGYWPRLNGYIALNASRTLGAPQTRYLQDASYFRLKNLTVDYSLPNSWLSKYSISRVNVFVTAQNVFTLSGLFKHTKSVDPEVIENSVGDLINSGGQGYAYPMLKTTTIGLNVTF